jgi:aspartyl-tRNA(Asn)/glutamyl-tRNA(Gln) amidotransferase subunit C
VKSVAAGTSGLSIEILTAAPGHLEGMSDEADGDVDADAGVDTDPEAGAVDTAADEVDPEEVRHVADLARVDLADDDVDRFTEQFADILASFEALDEVPEVEREEELANVMRPDEEHEGLTQEQTLSNAPETEDGYFKGPRVS